MRTVRRCSSGRPKMSRSRSCLSRSNSSLRLNSPIRCHSPLRSRGWSPLRPWRPGTSDSRVSSKPALSEMRRGATGSAPGPCRPCCAGGQGVSGGCDVRACVALRGWPAPRSGPNRMRPEGWLSPSPGPGEPRDGAGPGRRSFSRARCACARGAPIPSARRRPPKRPLRSAGWRAMRSGPRLPAASALRIARFGRTACERRISRSAWPRRTLEVRAPPRAVPQAALLQTPPFWPPRAVPKVRRR